MMRPILILTVLSVSGCMSMTDFRAGMGGGGSTAPARVTPAVTPAPVTPVMTAKERLFSAIEGQGCELNATNVGAILASATISREELLQLTPELQSEGRVEVSGGGAIRAISSTCA